VQAVEEQLKLSSKVPGSGTDECHLISSRARAMMQVLTITVNLALKTESGTNKKTSDFKGDIPFVAFLNSGVMP
jgi:hypothetical protein